MSTIIGKFTNEGLTKTIEAVGNEGWFIYPTKFGVTDIKGDLDANRTVGDINI